MQYAWLRPTWSIFLLISFALSAMDAAHARQRFFDWWLEEYAQRSTSGENTCHVCHAMPNGGDGWNDYGWRLRSVFLDDNQPQIGNIFDTEEQAFLATLRDVEFNFTDGVGSNTFIQEIELNAQPGWREGDVNQVQFRDAANNDIIEPPSTVCGAIDPASIRIPCMISDPRPSGIPTGDITIKVQEIESGFTAPILAVAAPTEENILYVVEQGGLVWQVDLNNPGARQIFVDFTEQVIELNESFDERGLLGFAFHPDYPTNNTVFTYISKPFGTAAMVDFTTLSDGETPDHVSVVSAWPVNQALPTDSTLASLGDERELLVVEQPQFNHNAGTVSFGPDGFLYISFGDGGGRDDVGVGHGDNGNGRDKNNPLGAILRIDVDSSASEGRRYAIPPSNPMVGEDGLDEIYAYGFRNPYRLSFEELSNGEFNLMVGDVGQGDIEEVNRISSINPGGNYGWNYKEGSFFFIFGENGTFVSTDPPVGSEVPDTLIDPIAEYDHDEGISVIGGHVYKGLAIPELANKYVFGDFSRRFPLPGQAPEGRLFYLDENDNQFEFAYESNQAPNFYITGFGVDNNKELYVLSNEQLSPTSATGSLNKIVVPEQPLCIPIRASNGNIALICL